MNTKYEENFISFIILTYNQEAYIEEALKSVINQDYSNYEIIISDDASTDKTVRIIQDIIDNNNSTVKNIFFNKNITNLGIVSNFTKALSLAKGEWIIGMGGDDMSYPDRISYTNQLINANKNIYAISCAFEFITQTGKPSTRGKSYHTNSNKFSLPYYKACSAAIHRDCFDKFDQITQKTFSEDSVFSMRALLLGGICISDKIVTKRRIHDNNTSISLETSNESLEKKKRCYIDTFGAHLQAKSDTIHIISNKEKQQNIIKLIDRETERRIKMINEIEFVQNVLYKKGPSSNFQNIQKGKSTKNVKLLISFLVDKSKILSYLKINFYNNFKLIFYKKQNLIDQKVVVIESFFHNDLD